MMMLFLEIKSTWKSSFWHPVLYFRMEKRGEKKLEQLERVNIWFYFTEACMDMNRIYGKGPKAEKNRQRTIEKKIRNKMMINSYIISVEMNM